MSYAGARLVTDRHTDMMTIVTLVRMHQVVIIIIFIITIATSSLVPRPSHRTHPPEIKMRRAERGLGAGPTCTVESPHYALSRK